MNIDDAKELVRKDIKELLDVYLKNSGLDSKSKTMTSNQRKHQR